MHRHGIQNGNWISITHLRLQRPGAPTAKVEWSKALIRCEDGRTCSCVCRGNAVYDVWLAARTVVIVRWRQGHSSWCSHTACGAYCASAWVRGSWILCSISTAFAMMHRMDSLWAREKRAAVIPRRPDRIRASFVDGSGQPIRDPPAPAPSSLYTNPATRTVPRSKQATQSDPSRPSSTVNTGTRSVGGCRKHHDIFIIDSHALERVQVAFPWSSSGTPHRSIHLVVNRVADHWKWRPCPIHQLSRGCRTVINEGFLWGISPMLPILLDGPQRRPRGYDRTPKPKKTLAPKGNGPPNDKR